MRILSATVKNYRIHRDLTVNFADSLTLIGGANESGKSTLTEAIHRALFLKSAVTGRVQEGMVSHTHPGHPEVEVSFETGGKSYTVRKTFSKGSGKTTFSETGGGTLQGAEAEARLAEVIQVEESGGGQGGAKKALAQWSHLWVWQGQGGEDPSEHASSQRDALLSRLKEQGGGVVMQSDLDSKVASKIQEKFDTIFTKSGKSKAGSDLQKAEEELRQAEETLEGAQSSFSKLEQAMRDFRQAEATLQTREKEATELSAQLEATRVKQKAVREFQHKIELETPKIQQAEERLAQWQKSLSEVDQLRGEVKQLSEQGKPAAEKLAVLESELKEKVTARQQIEAEIEKAESELVKMVEQRDLAEAWGKLLRSQETVADLKRKSADIQSLQKRQQEEAGKLARLPAINESIYQELQQLDSDLSESDAVLRAMSTGIEVIQSGGKVAAGEKVISEGEEHIIDRETLIQAGEEFVLKITPGGGNELEETRREAARIRQAHQEAFRKAGVNSVKEAGEIRGNRQALESSLGELKGELNGLKPEETNDKLEEETSHLAKCESEVERLSAKIPDFSAPADLLEARSIYTDLQAQIDTLKERLNDAKSRQANHRETLEQAELQLAREKETAQAAEHRLIEIRATLQTKEAPLGTAEEQATETKKRIQEQEAAAASLIKLRQQLEELQPDSIEADITRLERAIAIGKQEMERARDVRASARTLLSNDGTLDPTGALETAHSRAEAAKERFRSLSRRAEAIRLLRDRFHEEQQKLSDRFSQPLAETVTRYLKQIFGPSANATVSVEDGMIGGWMMTRDGTTFDFDSLSGGTREQVAAAVRLAIAEILAADYGGTLPVVFDDAFTHSDPERIQSLQRMLDLAARDGLQIILLTCHPSAYSGLGAETVNLSQSN